MPAETWVIRFDGGPLDVPEAQRAARPLGLLVLAAGVGRAVVMNNGMPGDMHLGLRARRLAEQLRQKVVEIRAETSAERRQRRDAADRHGQYNAGSNVPRQTAPRRR